MSSFLGLCNYLAPFVSRLSDVTEPLRQLIKKATIFTWNESYDRAFRRAKLCVANAVTLRYFDPDKSITIECDASGAGIGGALIQDSQPLLFVSQALTDMQKCYSNIEPRLVGSCDCCRTSTPICLCRKFTIHIDHSPLVNIFQKCLNDTSPHLQYLLLRLTQYQMNVVYVMQKCVPMADCLFMPCRCQNGQGGSYSESPDSQCKVRPDAN